MQRLYAHRSPAHPLAAKSRNKPSRPVRDFRARGKLTLVRIAEDTCILCEGTIDRFDREAFLITGRCRSCEDALGLS
jgi:hypothetical protein